MEKPVDLPRLVYRLGYGIVYFAQGTRIVFKEGQEKVQLSLNEDFSMTVSRAVARTHKRLFVPIEEWEWDLVPCICGSTVKRRDYPA